MSLDWKNLHVMAENIYDGSIQKHHEHHWDFSHLTETIQSIFKQHPGTDAYLYCAIEGCYDQSRKGSDYAEQAPNVVVLIVPTHLY